MDLRAVWVVQDRETGKFLYPYMGDVGLTRRFALAGRFSDPQEAQECADYHLGGSGELIGFWEKVGE